MQTVETVMMAYEDGLFIDELTLGLLYKNKDAGVTFMDENDNPISKNVVADWVMKKYYNKQKFKEYRNAGKGSVPEQAEQLYNSDEEYRKSVDEERLYLLYLIGVSVTKVANTFGVSRQTVYSRIKNFEENRLQEF